MNGPRSKIRRKGFAGDGLYTLAEIKSRVLWDSHNFPGLWLEGKITSPLPASFNSNFGIADSPSSESLWKLNKNEHISDLQLLDWYKWLIDNNLSATRGGPHSGRNNRGMVIVRWMAISQRVHPCWILGTGDYEFIWKKGLCMCIKDLEIRSSCIFGWAPNPSTCFSIRRKWGAEEGRKAIWRWRQRWSWGHLLPPHQKRWKRQRNSP